jgi:membrane-associated phospholipid phosphatase
LILFRSIHRAVCVALIAAGTAHAQTTDTITSSKKPLFVVHDLVFVAGFTLGTIALAPLDRHFTHQLQKPARQSNRLLKRSANVFRLLGQPGSLITGTGIYLLGRFDGQRRTEDMGLHTVEAVLLGSVEAGAIKVIAGRARPRVSPDNAANFQLLGGLRDDNHRSFPSGHATSAFAFAATVASETQRWWPGSRWIIGPILYGGATLTGMSRIYNNAHWASDVMAGAALGTFTGIKVVRYQHSHPGNYLDRKLLRAGISIGNGGQWMPIVSTVSY